MITKQDRVASIEAHIKALQDKLEEINNLPTCPLCGSEMRKYLKNKSYLCLQEMGHCGAIILNKVSRSRVAQAYYVRTSTQDGKVIDPTLNPNVYLATFFIGGKEVGKAEYLKA